MDDTKEIELFNKTYEIRLDAASFRLAGMRGVRISQEELNQFTNFEFGLKLAYIALLTELPEDVGEEELIKEVAKTGRANEIAAYMVDEFFRAQEALGKSMSERAAEIANQMMEEANGSLTSSKSTA